MKEAKTEYESFSGQLWSKMSKYMESTAKGGDEYYKTLADLVGEVDEFTAAQAALNAVQSGQLEPGTDEYTDALRTLASYTGLTAEYLQDHLGFAAQMLAGDMDVASDSIGYMTESLF